MTSAPTSPPLSAPTWAVFDLSLPGRADLLAKEQARWKDQGGVAFTARHKSAHADEFMDGVEIEDQWMKQEKWRAALQALRTELASAVDGEVFLRAARRAVWLAARAQRGPVPTMISGAGAEESLAACLAGRLLGVSWSGTYDARWKKLFEQLKTTTAAA